jgi:hypothetical protein
MKTLFLDGKHKIKVVKEKDGAVYFLALEDALIPDIDGRLQLMKAGKIYTVCKSCFNHRVMEVFL